MNFLTRLWGIWMEGSDPCFEVWEAEMGKLMVLAVAVKGWFQGKKTMLGGLVLIVAGVAGAGLGKLPVDQAVIVVGFGISICGWSAKANRHQAEILAALTATATAGALARSGNKAGAVAVLENAATAEVVAEATAAAAGAKA
jgi:hypothetical protein